MTVATSEAGNPCGLRAVAGFKVRLENYETDSGILREI
jgi:hypothetical protein